MSAPGTLFTEDRASGKESGMHAMLAAEHQESHGRWLRLLLLDIQIQAPENPVIEIPFPGHSACGARARHIVIPKPILELLLLRVCEWQDASLEDQVG